MRQNKIISDTCENLTQTLLGMDEFYRGLYEQLSEEIENCEHSATDFPKHIECCFHVCERISLLADGHASVQGFASAEHEIVYYKLIRPKFRRLAEFYSLVHGAALFEPEPGMGRRSFWVNEIERSQSFLNDNASLEEYMETGGTRHDVEYFTGGSEEAHQCRRLIIEISARRMYIDFIRKKIGE